MLHAESELSMHLDQPPKSKPASLNPTRGALAVTCPNLEAPSKNQEPFPSASHMYGNYPKGPAQSLAQASS